MSYPQERHLVGFMVGMWSVLGYWISSTLSRLWECTSNWPLHIIFDFGASFVQGYHGRTTNCGTAMFMAMGLNVLFQLIATRLWTQKYTQLTNKQNNIIGHQSSANWFQIRFDVSKCLLSLSLQFFLIVLLQKYCPYFPQFWRFLRFNSKCPYSSHLRFKYLTQIASFHTGTNPRMFGGGGSSLYWYGSKPTIYINSTLTWF